MAAVALRKQSSLPQAPPNREAVLARYRRLREISKMHHTKTLDFLSRDAVFHQARRLGLTMGRTFISDNMEELTLAFDLAIHTAPTGRSRAIDRYARSTRFIPESDEAMVLEAMRHTRFAIVAVKRRHPNAGLIVTELFREEEHWLVDEGLEMSFSEDAVLAIRYFALDEFIITAGVSIPIDPLLIEDALLSTPHLLRKSPAEAIDDRRFAEAVYRFALADGIMEGVAYQDLD